MGTALTTGHAPSDIERELEIVSRLASVPSILRLICKNTGLGFAAVARVTDVEWTACAVHDTIGFGLRPGQSLDLKTTLCHESRCARKPIVVDNFSSDPAYAGHITPMTYKLESYVSVPIVLGNGAYFGNLCGIDRRSVRVSDPATLELFELFAAFIALQLDQAFEQKATIAALNDERANSALREEFIAVLGHDLRNPLSAVSSSGEILQRHSDPMVVKIGDRIRASTRRMSGLIDDVMDYARSRLGSGIGVVPVAVPQLDGHLREVVAELRTSHPGCVIIEDIGALGAVDCDAPRIQQLLSNLLANAISHGSREHAVHVKAHRSDSDLIIAVENQGDVIAQSTMSRVFEPYWRPASSAPGGGLGLGLYICKQIVNGHQGTLEVSSTAEHGTCFTATIPLSH